MSIKLSSLNMKADERMFSDHLRILMRDVDLSFDQAHGYARIAYNEVRDKLDLSGEDVSDMNSSIEVLSTIKAIKNGAIELSDLFESVWVEPADTVQNPNGDELPKSAASQGLFSSQSEIQRGVKSAVLGMAMDKRNQIASQKAKQLSKLSDAEMQRQKVLGQEDAVLGRAMDLRKQKASPNKY